MQANVRNNISIIYFTKDRPEKLRQNISWHLNNGFRILIFDASEEKFEGLNDIDKGVSYVHMPNASLFERAKKAESVLCTDYFVTCADDDFLLQGAILELTNYLIKNKSKNFVAVQGRYMVFDMDSLYPEKVYGHSYSTYDALNIQDASALKRLLMLNSFPIFYYPYAICRRDVIENFNRITIDLEKGIQDGTASQSLFEPLMGIAVAVSGNYVSVNRPYSVRRPSKPWTTTSAEQFFSEAQYSSLQNILIKNILNLECFKNIDKKFACGYVRSVLDSYCNAKEKRLVFKARRNYGPNSESFAGLVKVLARRLYLKMKKQFTSFVVSLDFFDYENGVYESARSEVFDLLEFLRKYKSIKDHSARV
jgi:glycosyltransferase domain-containing protein